MASVSTTSKPFALHESGCPDVASAGPAAAAVNVIALPPVCPTQAANNSGREREMLCAHHTPPKVIANVANKPRGAPAVNVRSGTSVGCGWLWKSEA